jgi:hypothetical protein
MWRYALMKMARLAQAQIAQNAVGVATHLLVALLLQPL